jgi:hypothetical protein
MEEDEWAWHAGSTYGGNDKCVQNFGWKCLNRRDCSENLIPDERIILKWTLTKHGGTERAGII